MKLVCKVFRSSCREGMYLYVDASEGLERVPPELMQNFGAPVEAMTLLLTPERKLAMADARDVISTIEDAGFYLQMPPSSTSDMQDIAIRNNKLPL
jgi:hypothetical protein